MANKKLYREDVLQMLFADSDSEGEYLPFGNDDCRLMIALLPVHLLSELTECHWLRVADGQPDCVFFSDRARSTSRQYRCSQCGVGLPYSQEL